MHKRPLLSIITTNRNDNYHQNQLQRTKFILNYLIYSLKKMTAEKKVEYLIVDWGSNEPFSNYFYREISICPSIKFINIPKEETKKCGLNFDVSRATNIGIDKCLGEYVMLTSSDQFLPLSIFNNLLSLLEKPELYGLTGEEFKFVPRKFLEDDFCIYENNFETVDTYLQSLKQTMLPFPGFPMNSGGGAGGLLLKKKQLIEIGGIKETVITNRGQDSLLFHEITELSSHIDSATFGIYLLKLPRTKFGTRKEQLSKVKNLFNHLKFEKGKNIINMSNVEIINILTPSKKNLDFTSEPIPYTDSITIIEIIRCLSDCCFLTNSYKGAKLLSLDINFILKIKTIIRANNYKNIILDKRQAIRFLFYLSKTFPDITFIIFMDTEKNTQLEILKFRLEITSILKKSRHYGHIKVTTFNYKNIKSIVNLNDLCLIEDLSDNSEKQMFLKKEFKSSKIYSARNFTKVSNSITYDFEAQYTCNFRGLKLLEFNTVFNFIIYIIKFSQKVINKLSYVKRKFIN